MSNEELSQIEQLKQRYRKEAHLAIEEAKERTKKEIEEIYYEKIKILEEENRKWKAIAEGISEESNNDTENDPKAPLIRYIMEGVKTSDFSLFSLFSFLSLIVVYYSRYIVKLKRNLMMDQQNLKLLLIVLRYLPSLFFSFHHFPPFFLIIPFFFFREPLFQQLKNFYQNYLI